MAFGLSKITSAFGLEGTSAQRARVVGVDIGASSIKVVELSMRRDVPTLETYGELQLGPYGEVAVGQTVTLSAEKTTEALVDILRESSVAAKRAAVPISYRASLVTSFSVPTTDEERIDAIVPIEARKYIPATLREVSFDWFPIAQDKESQYTKILLAAIHNDQIGRYRTVVTKAGLAIAATEIELFSALRSVLRQSDADTAVIDFGANATKLYIAHHGTVSRTHTVRMHGAGLTDVIATELNVSFKEAEQLKRTFGIAPDADKRVSKVLRGVIERGLREAKQVMVRHAAEQIQVQNIVITGGGALLRGISEYAQDFFQCSVTRAHPFAKVSYPAFMEDMLTEAGPLFSVSIGAALRGIESP